LRHCGLAAALPPIQCSGSPRCNSVGALKEEFPQYFGSGSGNHGGAAALGHGKSSSGRLCLKARRSISTLHQEMFFANLKPLEGQGFP
jgi:hypothetical protein